MSDMDSVQFVKMVIRPDMRHLCVIAITNVLSKLEDRAIEHMFVQTIRRGLQIDVETQYQQDREFWVLEDTYQLINTEVMRLQSPEVTVTMRRKPL